MENFRSGYFEIQIRQIGFYLDKETSPGTSVVTPDTLTKEESDKKRPLLLKGLLPVLRLLFNEKVRRQQSALKILTQKRGMTFLQATLFGIRNRAASYGMPAAVTRACGMLVRDSINSVVNFTLRLVVFYPFSAIMRVMRYLKKPKQGLDKK